MEDLLRRYIDVGSIPANCGSCPNYGKVWSCPPYDFDPERIWRKYRRLLLVAEKIVPDTAEGAWNDPHNYTGLLRPFRLALDETLGRMEKETPGSLRLNAGRCFLCERCSRAGGEGCRYPEDRRYSLESLGGAVGKIAEEYLGVPLHWGKPGEPPPYFLLVGALLIP